MKRLLAIAFLLGACTAAQAAFNTIEKQTFSNIAATTSSFTLRGGNYGLTCKGTWGGGNAALQRLAADNTTYVTVITALTADGYANANLPNGTYRIAITTATGV